MRARAERNAIPIAIATIVLVVAHVQSRAEPDRTLLTFDGATWLMRVLDIAEGRAFPAIGNVVGSQAISHGPAADYLAVPAFRLGGSILAIVRWFGFLEAITASGFAWYVARRLGALAGLMAGLFFVLHPIPLESVVQLRHDGLLPATSLAAFLGIALTLDRAWRRPALVAFATGVMVGVASQAHAIAIVYLPVLPIAAWCSGRPLSRRAWLGYSSGVLITYASWLAHDFQHGWEQSRTAWSLLVGAAFRGAPQAARRTFWQGFATVSHPHLLFPVGVALGCVVIAVAAVRNRGTERPEAGDWRALVATALVSLASSIAFVAFVASRGLGYQEVELGRYFLPALIPASVLAGVGWGWPTFGALAGCGKTRWGESSEPVDASSGGFSRPPPRKKRGFCGAPPPSRLAMLVAAPLARASFSSLLEPSAWLSSAWLRAVVGAGSAAIGLLAATGLVGEGAQPYWDVSPTHGARGAGGNPFTSYRWCERIHDRIVLLVDPREIGAVVWLGSLDGSAENDPENLERVAPLLRASGAAEPQRASSSRSSRIVLLEPGDSASTLADAAARASEPRLGVTVLDATGDCSALVEKMDGADESAAIRGLRLRVNVFGSPGRPPEDLCDDSRWREWIEWRGGVGQSDDPKADGLTTDTLLTQLDAGTLRARIEAAWSLGTRSEDRDRVLVPLERAFAAPDPRLRIAALWSIARLTTGDIPRHPLVLGALRDPDEHLRRAAAAAIDRGDQR